MAEPCFRGPVDVDVFHHYRRTLSLVGRVLLVSFALLMAASLSHPPVRIFVVPSAKPRRLPPPLGDGQNFTRIWLRFLRMSLFPIDLALFIVNHPHCFATASLHVAVCGSRSVGIVSASFFI